MYCKYARAKRVLCVFYCFYRFLMMSLKEKRKRIYKTFSASTSTFSVFVVCMDLNAYCRRTCHKCRTNFNFGCRFYCRQHKNSLLCVFSRFLVIYLNWKGKSVNLAWLDVSENCP